MNVSLATPIGPGRLDRIRVLHLCLAAIACGTAAATYSIATRVDAKQPAAVSYRRVNAEAPPSAQGFGRFFVRLTNRYAKANGDATRVGDADCVQASAGHYMCSYAVHDRRGRATCHIMQARWTPRQASSFTVTLAGQARHCGSLREALRSLG